MSGSKSGVAREFKPDFRRLARGLAGSSCRRRRERRRHPERRGEPRQPFPGRGGIVDQRDPHERVPRIGAVRIGLGEICARQHLAARSRATGAASAPRRRRPGATGRSRTAAGNSRRIRPATGRPCPCAPASAQAHRLDVRVLRPERRRGGEQRQRRARGAVEAHPIERGEDVPAPDGEAGAQPGGARALGQRVQHQHVVEPARRTSRAPPARRARRAAARRRRARRSIRRRRRGNRAGAPPRSPAASRSASITRPSGFDGEHR